MKPTFTAQEITQIQKLLREAASGPEDRLETTTAMRMLSDEIEALRLDGIDDDQIAALISQSVGGTITADEVARLFVPLQDRHDDGPSPRGARMLARSTTADRAQGE